MTLLHEEQRVEHDRLGERDRQDRLHHDLGGGVGIASDRRRGAEADQSDADRRAQGGQADVHTAIEGSGHHTVLSGSWCWQMRSVNTAVRSMKTSACTRPTSNSMK